MKLIRLTHATFNTHIYVPTVSVFSWYHSPNSKCTHIVASGGAMLPVSESVDEVARLYNSEAAPAAEQTDATASSKE